MPIWVILAISIPSIIIVLVYKLGIIPGKLKNKMPKESIEEYNNLKEQISCLKSTNETLKSLTEEFDANDYESKIDLFQNIVKNIPNLSDAQNNEERFNIINDFLCNYAVAILLIAPSIFKSVPTIAPNTTDAIKIKTFSPTKLPDIPIYNVQAPKPIIAARLTFSGIPFLNNKPIDEPIITVITLTITPNI